MVGVEDGSCGGCQKVGRHHGDEKLRKWIGGRSVDCDKQCWCISRHRRSIQGSFHPVESIRGGPRGRNPGRLVASFLEHLCSVSLLDRSTAEILVKPLARFLVPDQAGDSFCNAIFAGDTREDGEGE
uniref:Uncharacterized protein n=1 Tax=Proboscia inermis TaxID=420281 RepID=A0A6T8PCH8_9STRA|mmetsp:Transcript_8378/g.8546  ORF Transcript_8378/g.8546 Transcript_8378/m.8546 type:complete len:127 (+) Transcript_8378:676-1056(+)